ncbi:MAG: amidohydrolase [Candidatus Obscuribacterales bacterium]|nr:amidohydrolase [Candidatus Obscuribacterales bacterium]
MLEEALELQDELVQLRRHFHSHPELSFEEHETAAFVADYLEKADFRIRKGFGETAVVADLGPAPYIAIRADLDALPIHEQNVSAHVSRKQGVMHACGHDAHMAVVLACGKLLARKGGLLKKGLRLIFEPGTESNERSGAKELLAAGVLDGVEGLLGFHVDSTVPVFDVMIVKDLALHSAVLNLQICTGTEPEKQGSDYLILQSAKLISKLKEVLPGNYGRSELKRLELLELKQEAAKMTLRASLNADSADDLTAALAQLEAVCQAHSASINSDLNSDLGSQSQRISAQYLETLIAELPSPGKCKVTSRRAWSKDFEMYAEKVPSAFFYLGTSCGTRTHHSASFELDERALYLALAIMAKTVLSLAL